MRRGEVALIKKKKEAHVKVNGALIINPPLHADAAAVAVVVFLAILPS